MIFNQIIKIQYTRFYNFLGSLCVLMIITSCNSFSKPNPQHLILIAKNALSGNKIDNSYCVIHDEKLNIISSGNTPMQFNTKSSSKLIISCSKDGYKNAEKIIEVVPSDSYAKKTSNSVTFIAGIADDISGSSNVYPDIIYIGMEDE